MSEVRASAGGALSHARGQVAPGYYYMFDDPREKALRDAIYQAIATLGGSRRRAPALPVEQVNRLQRRAP